MSEQEGGGGTMSPEAEKRLVALTDAVGEAASEYFTRVRSPEELVVGCDFLLTAMYYGLTHCTPPTVSAADKWRWLRIRTELLEKAEQRDVEGRPN